MKAIMVVGTESQVGKSLVVTALCRLLVRRGWRVAPFKGQSTFSRGYITMSGAEIAYSQAVQAWAANIVPQLDMNPIILKPEATDSVQVRFAGTIVEVASLDDYQDNHAPSAWQVVTKSLQKLAQDFDLVVAEGGGSAGSIHPLGWDMGGMRLAQHLNATTILVANAKRGGAIAQILGTLDLLPPDARSLVRGIVLNQTTQSTASLQAAKQWLEERTGIPVLGNIPPLDDIMPGDGSLDMAAHRDRQPHNPRNITITVVRLPYISNFTDFDALDAEITVTVTYADLSSPLGHPDAVILPGSKNAIADLIMLQKSGMATAIKNYAAAGGTVIGICGGYQMMGKFIADPEGRDGQEGRYPGLNLLPVKTVISGQKIARERHVTSTYPDTEKGFPVSGFEFCYGRTSLADSDRHAHTPPSCRQLFEEPGLGIVDSGLSLWGTYLHGLFDNSPWRRSWLNRLRHRRGLQSLPTGIANYQEQREAVLNSLADRIAHHLELSTIL